MKKLLLFLFPILVSIFLFPNLSFATEGTCSWHGGVKCAAGADWDGSVICTDGWRDSSERFYSQQKCRADLYYCSATVALQLKAKYRLDELYQIADQKCTIPPELMPATGDSTSDSRVKAIKSLELSVACSSAQGDYNLAADQYDRECYLIGESEYYQRIADFYKKYEASTSQLDQSQTPYSGSQSTIKADIGSNLTPDERCKKFGLGDWYNTDKQSCDICPDGVEKKPNTNSCWVPPKPVPVVATIASPKPKEVESRKFVENISTTIATNTQEVSVVAEPVSHAVEEIKTETPLPLTSAPAPRSFWAKIISWFKFW